MLRLLLLGLFWWCGSSCLLAAEPELKLLFLGDRGPHRPQERFAQLAPVLEPRGILLQYTDDPSVLSHDTLHSFDGLIIYANHDTITPDQEQALLQFVARGKGFVALHCASYCFRNSAAYIELVGAQFQRHGGQVFRVENVQDHPILQGFGGFESWDETYIHTRHQEAGRTVLQIRRQGDQAPGRDAEPWTWVKPYGQGRVFYTAWGHDHRTWGHPGFHNLVERGIRWACGRDPTTVPAYRERPAFEPLPMTSLPPGPGPFEYVDVGPKIPNYTPGARWGTQGRPYTQMQKPLPPQVSQQRYVVPQGFHLELFVSEPELQGKPIAMNWDERGRLWVCETVDYPNELHAGNKGRDRIRICEDRDGDGRADHFTIFAEHLSIPTSLAFAYGGVVVQNGTETLFLQDTDGDDRADVRHVLITGWNMGDTHGGVSNFQYGFDNWIWAMQGYNNSQPVYGQGQRATPFRMGFFRFRVTRSAPREGSESPPISVTDLEFLRSTDNNTWGLGMSEEGLIFGSTANHNPSVFLSIPNRYYERVRGWSPEVLKTIADTHLFKAITDKIRQVDQFGGYTAGAGHALYTARRYPETFWNRTAFVCEPTGHLVGTFVLSPQGSDFVATSPMNLVASDDEWAAPIMAEVGPDGCVWIIDWYNFIVQHNPTPEGFRTGKGNAYESDLRDKKHGRIYRLVYAQPTSLEDQAPLSSQDPAQLVSALRRPNLLWRRHAQRLLVERQQRDVVPALLKLVSDPTTDALGLNVGAIHALWTLQGLGVITPEEEAVWNTVTAALNHPSAGVRRNAIMVLPAVPESAACLLSSKVLHDTQPQVRLAAFLAMADLPEHRDLAKQVAENLLSHAVMADRWLGDALTSAAAMQGAAVWQELSSRLTQGVELPSRTVDVLKLIAGHIARSRPQSDLLSATIAAAAQHPVLLNLCMQGLSAAWPRDHRVELSADAQQQLLQVFEKSPDTALQGAVLQLSQELGLRGLEAYVEQLQQRLLAVLADPQQTSAARIQSARDLVRLHPRSESVVEALLQHITPQTPQDLAVGLIDALRDSQADRLGSLLLGQLPRLTPAVRQAALRLMLSRPVTTRTLLAAIRERQIPLDDLSLDQKQALATHPDRNIRQLAAELLSAQGGLPDPDRQKVLDAWRHVAERQGDATLGKEVFKKQCAKCHTHSGEGTRIGPDLTGMSVHPKHELLVHILDPSRSVEGNFRVYTVALNDGRVLSGMLASETRTAIELIDTEAKRHPISRDDIDELVASPKSLMPEGFEKQLTPDDMTHLLEFLTTRGKYFPLDLRKVATATSTKGMFVFEEADHERLIFPDWSPKTVDGIPFQLVDPQGDRVPNVVLLYSPNGTLPTRMPRRVSLPCNSPAKALHFLSGVAGWGHPFGEPGSVSMIVRLHYADGSTEDHELKNGIHFADYIRVVDVPGSKLAFRLRGQQIRYFAIQPQHTKPINTVELIKGPDATAPVVMAITVETP